MKKVCIFFGVVELLFSVFTEASQDGLVKEKAAVTQVFPSKFLEVLESKKTALKQDAYCDRIKIDKYILAKNTQVLSKIEELELLTDKAKKIEDVNTIDISSLVAEIKKGDGEVALTEEISRSYDQIRQNKRFVLWSMIYFAVA